MRIEMGMFTSEIRMAISIAKQIQHDHRPGRHNSGRRPLNSLLKGHRPSHRNDRHNDPRQRIKT